MTNKMSKEEYYKLQNIEYDPEDNSFNKQWKEKIEILGLKRLNNDKWRLYNVKSLKEFVSKLLENQKDIIIDLIKCEMDCIKDGNTLTPMQQDTGMSIAYNIIKRIKGGIKNGEL